MYSPPICDITKNMKYTGDIRFSSLGVSSKFLRESIDTSVSVYALKYWKVSDSLNKYEVGASPCMYEYDTDSVSHDAKMSMSDLGYLLLDFAWYL